MENYIYIYGAVVLYLACAALLFFHIKRLITQAATQVARNTGALTKKQIILIGAAGLILHGLALNSTILSPLGLNLGFYNAMSLISAFIVLFILTATWRHPIEILLIALLPIAAASLLLDIGNKSDHLLAADSSNALIFHIITSLIAYSLLALAALQAILFSVQSKFLHAHQPGGFIKLMPPLKDMEALLFEMILIGFITLTIALGSGLIFLENMFAQQLVHKTILSILAWFVFLTLLIGHWKLGWRGRIAVRWTLAGFASLMLAYFGSKFVLEIVLI